VLSKTIVPKVEEFMHLVSKCEKGLAGTSFLSRAGRLELVNYIFSSLPTFIMSTLSLLTSIIKQIIKYRKHCL